MDRIKFQAWLVAPYFPDAPPEIKDNWLKQSLAAIPKGYQHLKQAVKTKQDVIEKVMKPGLRWVERAAQALPPDAYISEHGRDLQGILNRARKNMPFAAKRYFKKRKYLYESGRYESLIELGLKRYTEKWCAIIGPLKGYQKGGIKGLNVLGTMVLTADKRLSDFLKKGQDKIEGELFCVTSAEKLSRFKRMLLNQIVKSGSEIIGLDFMGVAFERQNAKINQVINEYRLTEILPFSPAGESHIDFIKVEIPNPAEPDKTIPWPGLDIQVVSY